MSILIKNLRTEKPTEPWQIKVDRSSMFGNPYSMFTESERDAVCDKYEEHFNSAVMQKRLSTLLGEICSIYVQYGKLELFCWCAPKRCHAETIKNHLLRMIELKDGESSMRDLCKKCKNYDGEKCDLGHQCVNGGEFIDAGYDEDYHGV